MRRQFQHHAVNFGIFKMTLQDKKLFLFDIDGTLSVGLQVLDGTLDLLAYLRASGRKYLFLTNNSTMGIEGYLAKMDALGIASVREEHLGSAQATVQYLKRHYAGKKLYVLGTKALRSYFASEGLWVTDIYGEDVEVLVLGYDNELTYQKLTDATRLLARDIPYIATKPDPTCPAPWGYLPDCGSIAAMLETATGKKPHFIGKPAPTMVELAMEQMGYAPSETVMVGDSMLADIGAGVNAGVDTVLLLGTRSERIVEDFAYRPTYVYENIRQLYKALIGE